MSLYVEDAREQFFRPLSSQSHDFHCVGPVFLQTGTIHCEASTKYKFSRGIGEEAVIFVCLGTDLVVAGKINVARSNSSVIST